MIFKWIVELLTRSTKGSVDREGSQADDASSDRKTN
jgi:hypothetical protein